MATTDLSTMYRKNTNPRTNVGFAWQYVIPQYLNTEELSNTSQLSKSIHSFIQPQINRLVWWNYGDDGWKKGYRLRFNTDEPNVDSLPSQLTHIVDLPAMCKLPKQLQQLSFSNGLVNMDILDYSTT